MADATEETEHVLRLTCMHEQDQKPPQSLVIVQPIKQYCHYLVFLYQKSSLLCHGLSPIEQCIFFQTSGWWPLMPDATKETKHVFRLTCIYVIWTRPKATTNTGHNPTHKQYCLYLIFFQKQDQVSSISDLSLPRLWSLIFILNNY